MTKHLLLVTLGPVQEFIAQARRTRDLWYGSNLLSEISLAAAKHLAANEAELIFPAPWTGDKPGNVANRLLAELPANRNPADLARSTREAAQRCWRTNAERVRNDVRAGLIDADAHDAWEEQIDTFLEFSAAWAPVDARPYREVRGAVERALAGRKNLRDFHAWRHPRGVRKSSLDGERETVLRAPRLRDPALVRRYRIEPGEELDAVGLVKRAGATPGQFVPIVNVATACWVREAAERAPAALDGFRNACERLGVHPVHRPDLSVGRQHAYDASLLLRGRWRPVLKEYGQGQDPSEWGRNHVQPLYDALRREPHPYVACLVADGDQMGRAINNLDSAEAHRRLSRSLAAFAHRAREIVEQEHLGSLVYAGGDDVLAFLPLPTAAACAAALRATFNELVEAGDIQPTLSVGLGVGHVMEGMGDLLELGRQAERFAKEGRNALAVVVDKRSGETRRWRASWDDAPADRLREAVAALGGRLPMSKVYEIDRTLRRLPGEAETDDRGWRRALGQEVRHSLSRVRAGEAALKPADVGLDLDGPATFAELRHEVATWLERMLVARTFAMAEAPR